MAPNTCATDVLFACAMKFCATPNIFCRAKTRFLARRKRYSSCKILLLHICNLPLQRQIAPFFCHFDFSSVCAAAFADNSIHSLDICKLRLWRTIEKCCHVIYSYKIRFRLWRFRCHLGTFFGWYVAVGYVTRLCISDWDRALTGGIRNHEQKVDTEPE
ncbi:unnamed protein product [Prunus armeniaca]